MKKINKKKKLNHELTLINTKKKNERRTPNIYPPVAD